METYFPFDETLKSTDGTQATFTRASAATNPDTGATVAANTPRFVEGKFGQAVLVEEGTTNLLSTDTATLEGGLGDWTAGAGVTIARVQDSWPGRVGSWSLKVSGAISGTQAARFGAPLVTGVTRTASVLIHAPTAMTIGTDFYGNAVGYVSLQAGETRRIVRTWMASFSSGVASFRIWNNTGALFYCDQAQYEEKPYATSFVDGTRAGETLRIPSSVMNDNEGTLEIWAKKSFVYAADRKILDAQTPRIDFQWDAAGHLCADFGGANIAVSDPSQDTAWHHYALTYSGRTVKMYYDGTLLGSGTATVDLVSFSNLFVGSRYAPYSTGLYQGNAAYSQLRIHRRALTDEEIAAHAQAIAPDRQIHTKLLVGRTDGITWADLTDCLARVQVELGDVTGLGTDGTGGDMPVRRMTMTLRNDGAALSPHIQASALNQFGGKYAPLLWPMREVILDVATTAPGFSPSTGDWVRLFHGYLGDSIQVDENSVTCACRDLAKQLQNTYIETVREYGSKAGIAAETVIQSILNDNLGAGVVTLYTPISPGFMLHPYRVEYQSVWDAIQQIAAQIGWWLGYRWRAATQRLELTLMAPPRYKHAGNYALTGDDSIYTQPLDISDADIRNVVAVTYKDRTLGKRRTVTVSDAVSILEYGRRAMGIEEQNASLIDTAAEAQALAQAAVDDLRDMTGTTRITMPLLPQAQLFDGIDVENPLVSDQDDFYGVDSVMHDLDFEGGRFRTEIIASRRVVGARTRWLRMQTRPGGTLPITGGDVIGGQATATLVVAASDSSWRGRESADYMCDGVSDQVQINDALDWLVSDGRTGGKVMLLEGTYVIDGHILMPSNTQIEGQGPSTVIKIKDGYTLPGYGSKLYMIANKDGSSGNSRLRVAHLTLDGNKAHTSETAYIWTILWWYASDSAVEDVQSINSPAHDIEVYGSRNRVVGCRMRDARTGGLQVTDGSSCTVTDNVVENCGTHGISLSMLSGSVCNNNVSTGNEFGISVYECASCTVSGNAISLSGYDGIYMYKCVECQVTGNNITSSGQKTNPDWGNSGIRVFWESSRNNIQHNTIRRGSGSMKPAYGIWIQSADCDRNLVTNNDLFESGATTSLKNDGTNTVTTAGNRA